MVKYASFLFVLLVVMWSSAHAQVTFESLLMEMVDRDAAPRQPDPWFTCAQASSYERASVAPDQPGWFANRDWRRFIREEEHDGRRELVMMDAEGPGAIVRFWATFAAPRGGEFSNGTIRFYLDDDDKPVLEGPILGMLSGGELAGSALSFRAPEYEDKLLAGHNLYLPIPYGKRCKVTYETKGGYFTEGDLKGLIREGFYYNINYRTYSQDTPVQTLTADILKRTAPLRERIEQQLALPSPPEPGPEDRRQKTDGILAPGAKAMLTFDGGGAVCQLRCRLAAAELRAARRATVLKIRFDGETTVWAPVGDFFGAGVHPAAWKTWWSGVEEDGTFCCYWIMPFQRQAQVIITNLAQTPVTLETLEARVKPYAWNEKTMYFHGGWRLWYRFKAGDHEGFDLNWLTVKGAGKYMGDAVSIFNGGWRWWGEGDEKIYVDGESFPSHFGTGTEDYYGYAWGRPQFYTSAFLAQPTGEGNRKSGYSVNNRFRILDSIPFKQALKFDMEFISQTGGTFNYAPTFWWYAAPGAKANVKPASPQDVRQPIDLAEDDIMQPPTRK